METELFEKIKKTLVETAEQSSFPEESFHSINTLEWLLKLKPDANIALQIAAVGHDIERAYEDKKIVAADYDSFDEFKMAHALNSAEILAEILEELGAEQEIVDDVAHLVAHHESGGDDREELLKNANSVSFFHVCLPLYYDRRGPDSTRKRCVWAYKKLPEDLRTVVAEFEYMDEELKTLVSDSLGLDD